MREAAKLATAIDVSASAEGLEAPIGLGGAQGDLLDLLPVPAYACDRDGVIIAYNSRAADLWGRRPKLGDPTQLFCGSLRLHRLDGGPLPHAECPMAEVLRSGVPIRGREVVVERPDGSFAVAHVNIEPLRDLRGVVTGAINCFLDISEQKRAQAALVESEERSRELLQALPVAVYTTDEKGRITFYNEAAAELWGTRPTLGESEWCGSWKLAWPDGRPMRHDECPMAIALTKGIAISGAEAAAVRPNGERVPFLAFPTPLRSKLGEVVGAVNMLVDIAGKKQAEHASNLLASIVESSNDGIVSKNLDGIITSWNAGAERLFGYTAKEAVGRPILMLIPPDRHDEERDILARIRRGERVEHYETVRRRRDGSPVEVSLTISPIKNSKGEVVGASKIARDITERKRAEEQRRVVLREMGHRVKNLFALASSVVGQSARWAKTPEDMADAVKQRLAALARAHELMLPDIVAGDMGASRSTHLGALVDAMLAPYGESAGSGGGTRAVGNGPRVPIAGNAVTSFALLLHEFATNATKYGALSALGGRVAVGWSLDGETLQLTWREEGGPPVNGAPRYEGFGSVLAANTVKHQFNGDIAREWRREGLVIRLSIPVEHLGS